MIIYYSYFICIAVAPLEDDSPLLIDSNAIVIVPNVSGYE